MEKEKINCCVKCGHKMKQRGKRKPKVCSLCKSPNWDKRNLKDLVRLIVGETYF